MSLNSFLAVQPARSTFRTRNRRLSLWRNRQTYLPREKPESGNLKTYSPGWLTRYIPEMHRPHRNQRSTVYKSVCECRDQRFLSKSICINFRERSTVSKSV
jgi:hypothetical protein